MRILVVTNLFPTETSPHGGVFIAHRVRALRAEGHHVTAVALDLSRGPLPRRQRALALTPPGLDDVFVRLSVPLSLPARVALRLGRFDGVVDHVAEFLDQWRGGTTFDVVHAHGMYPPMPAGAVAKNLAARFGIGYVVTCHGSDITLMTARNRPRYVDVLASATGVTFPSNDLKDRATRLGARSTQLAVIPNGVDTEVFTPADPDGAAPSAPRVTFVGNLREVKGADRLPAVFKAINAKRSDVRFTVVGIGPLGPSLRSELEPLDVALVGHLDQTAVAEVMRSSSVLVMPSRAEGFGCVVLESQACGIPVVATDVGGLPEAVGDRRLLATDDADVVSNLARLCLQVLNGDLLYDSPALVARAREHDWRSIARQEAAFLQSGSLDGDTA